MVPAYLATGIIPPEEVEIVGFDRCPRTGPAHVGHLLLHFPGAWRLGRLGNEKRGHARLLAAESVFGEVVDVSGAL